MSEDSTTLVKLVIVDQDRRILVESSDGLRKLPAVTIPLFTRVTYEAMQNAREKYHLNLFNILFVPSPSVSADSIDIAEVTLVCRLQNPTAPVSTELSWVESPEAPLEVHDRIAVESAMKEFDKYDGATEPSSFGRYRSFDDLRAWYAPHLERLGVRETGVQQWNSDPWYALFRIKVEPVGERTTEAPHALWFKAVGEPNTREFAVTLALTEECPYWFPRIVGSNVEWNGWLMEGVNGHELDEETDGRPWALTARILAKVQKRFVGREDELLALGCRDWRMPRVLEALDPFFEDMEVIMRRQTNETVQRLDSRELRELKIQCKDLCHRVEDVDVPYTIAHGDFSPHNVIVSNGWPVLIDWAEAYVSFPFISWEYFWNRMIKDHPEHTDWRERMHRNYAYRVWAPLLTARRVDEGLRLSPAMAVLILTLYGIDDPEQRQNRRADRVKRSLVRRLHRELGVLNQAAAEPVGAL